MVIVGIFFKMDNSIIIIKNVVKKSFDLVIFFWLESIVCCF